MKCDQCAYPAAYHWQISPGDTIRHWYYCEEHHEEAVTKTYEQDITYFSWEKLVTEEERADRIRWMEEISS